MSIRRLFTFFLFFAIVLVQIALAQTISQPQKRPKIGLVLSGGGARGIAHIGVLEWFEENHIPVDYVVGTSMGGIVGGIYATGKTPAEMLKIIEEIDWDDVLRSTPPYNELSFRRKQDRRENQTVIEFGLKNGVRVPSGLNSGHKVDLILERLTLPYSKIESFDELVVPFRAVATDMIKGEAVILKDGSLSTALRATMAFPGVFTPVEREGKILADGGLVNNIPTDIAKKMGADIIIAVDIGTPLSTDPKALESIGGVLSQSIGIALIGNDRRNLALADIIIAPDLGKYTLFDFQGANELYKLGYKGADAKSLILKNLALDDAAWAEYTAQRNARRKTEIPVPQSLALTGDELKPIQAETLEKKLEKNIGKQIEPAQLEKDLNEIRGEGRLESLGYGIGKINGRDALLIRVGEKSNGPTFLTPEAVIEFGGEDEVFTTLGGRFVFFDIGGYRSELRTDLKFGSETVLAGEFYKPFGERGFFVAPRLYYESRIRSFFENDLRIADFRVRRFGAGIDAGYTFRRGEFRLGFDINHLKTAPRVGSPDLLAVKGYQRRVFARYELDTTDDAVIPTKGMRLGVEGRYYFSSPGASSGFPQGEANFSAFRTYRKKGIVFLDFSGGTTFDRSAAPTETFQLGGTGRLSAYRRNEFSGNNFVLTRTGYLREIYTLPSLLGGKVYLLGAIETGGAFGQFRRANYRTDLTGGVIVVTSLGPITFGTSFGEGGRRKIFFSLGRVF
jgi:NTE family protein